jgi:xanthine dehydrogenase/oxidase
MPGQATPFGMIMGENYAGEWHVPFMWDKLYKECDVSNRRLAISEFNKKHKWLKRGLAFTPTKFGIAFTSKFMNQGGALVHLYTDGTVLVTHGGTEMVSFISPNFIQNGSCHKVMDANIIE